MNPHRPTLRFIIAACAALATLLATDPRPACAAARAGDERAAWADRARWPARAARAPSDPSQGIVLELPAGRTTHVWRTISSRSAAALALWNTEADAAALFEAVPQAERPKVLTEIGQGGFGFVRQERRADERREDPACAAAMMFVSARQETRAGFALNPDGLTSITVLQRTWFALYDPGKGPARGIAVVMPGIFGTPEAVFDQVVRHFQSRGWVVLRMMAQPSGYTERLDVDIHPGPEAERNAATLLARAFDDRAAECAYAVEAALAWAEEKRPEVRGGHRVILGGSGGAMSLPPVAARLPGTFDAAVLIAGGADFASIAATSNYEDWIDSVHIRWSGQVGTPQQIRSLSDAYLEESLLDAYHTAPALKGTRLLVLQASRDKAVPATQQELLWQRLGEPERRLLSMGHETLFVSLPLRMSGIMDWLDDALSPEPPPQPRENAQSPDRPHAHSEPTPSPKGIE